MVPVPGHGDRALNWTLFTQASAWNEELHKNNNYREISSKSGVAASTAYEKVNTTSTDENLFRLVVSVPGHGDRVIPL